MVSLAKENEAVFIPDDPQPVYIAKDSPALHILQRARNEAHRFAISYHQKLRHKKAIASALDDIPGIGPKRKKALLKKFGSVEAIKEASAEELSQTEGITLALAQKIKGELVNQ
jgi:excinuclease ABC subunit C